MAKVSTFFNFPEPLSAKGISNSGPVRWSKKHVNFSKVRIGKAYEVATGTPWRKPPCIPEWRFHTPTSVGRVSDTKCYPGAAVLLWKTTQNSKGFLKRLSGHCYHPKRREVRLKRLLFFDLLCYRVQYQVPFHPYFPLCHQTDPTRSFCNAQLAVTTLPNGIFTSTVEEKHFNSILSHSQSWEEVQSKTGVALTYSKFIAFYNPSYTEMGYKKKALKLKRGFWLYTMIHLLWTMCT